MRHVAALVARRAEPVVQADVRRFRVVGREDRLYEREEIEDPAAIQGCLDGSPRIPCTELFLAHVGVRHG